MKFPDKLMFGTAGIPVSTQKPDTVSGIARVRELGLDAMELEFVHSVNISRDRAPDIKKAAQERNIFLTCHAPYFINLNAREPETRHASMQRIEKSAEILDACGGWSVCFHPGYYLGMEKRPVYDTVKKGIQEIRERLEDKGIGVWIRPETTGKPTQFGDIEELLKISEDLEKVMPVIDFSHLHARTNGGYNTEEEFRQVLSLVEKHLGRSGLENMHIHVSGIEYGEKGEKNHLILEDSDMNYTGLLKVWREFRIRGVVISESPNIEGDAILMQKGY